MQSRFERLRDQIDAYIKVAVKKAIDERVRNLTADYLKPFARSYLDSALEAYLKQYLQSSLEEALEGMETAFDVQDDASPGSELEREEEGSGSLGPSLFTNRDLTPPPVPAHLVALAFIQKYQCERNTNKNPRTKQIVDGTGLSSVDVLQAYSKLRDEGRIEGPTGTSRNKTVTVLNPLPNPEEYLP